MNINQIISDLYFILPEIILIGSSLFALLYGLFTGEKDCHVKLFILIGMCISLFTLLHISSDPIMLLNNSLVYDGITRAFRGLILMSSIICILFIFRIKTQFEVAILMTISTMGLMLMVASNDFITMYLTMELSALTMYICVASNKKSALATEAGLKYFILGSIASCIFLFGVSIISGFSGSFIFAVIGDYVLENSSQIPILLIFSVILILVAFFFKMSLAPFHTWLADVYHGAPVYASLFIGSTSKIAICGLLIRAIYSLFDTLHLEIQTLLIVVGLLSIFVGAICAIMQKDLRRILAYSSISNMGFAIAGIGTGSANGIASGFIYVALYSLLMFIPSFVLISLLANAKHKDDQTILLCDLRELSISNPYKIGALTFLMFSTAGLPPFAGFFGKFFILMQIIAQDMTILSILFIIGAILSSVYCIRVIKNIYFTTIDFNAVLPTTSLHCRFEVILITLICCLNFTYCLYASNAMMFITRLFREVF